MDEKIVQLIDSNKTLLCLFKPGYLLEMHEMDIEHEENDKSEHLELEGYAIRQLNRILNCISNYLGMMYYPQEYRDMLYSQLDELRYKNDFRQVERKKIINASLSNINVCCANDDYFKGFIITTLRGILGEVLSLDLDEQYKEEKKDLILDAISRISDIDKKDDPDDDLKRQIYTDVHKSIMPTVEEGVKYYEGDPEVKLWLYMSDIQDDVDAYVPDEFCVYRFEMDDRHLTHDPITMDMLDDIIDTLVKWAEYEISILVSHPHADYFMYYQEALAPFIEGHNYYKGIHNVTLLYPELLLNKDFVDNVEYIFLLRSDTESLLRKKLELLIELLQQDCFEGEEKKQIAVNYSEDKEFYECLKSIIDDYPGLCESEIFYKNIRQVVGLKPKCAKKVLGRAAYKELNRIFKELDEKG